ncbi:MAG TPA: TonB-dependent receptor, partial [Phenylobacterium sp.]
APDPDLRLADVERVEVLRGPQGTLYGSGSIGGIVRIVTAKPDPARFAAHAVAEAMINQHDDEAYGLEAMINLPVLRGRGAVRFVAYTDEISGYLNNPFLGSTDVNHSQRSGVRVSGLADVSNNWRAQLSFSRQGIKAADSQYTEGARRLQRDTGIAEPHDNDFTQVSATLSHTGSAAEARISAAFIDHDQSTRYDASGAFDLRPGWAAAFDEAQRAKLWVGEALAVSASGGRSRWLVGVFGSYAEEASSGDLDATISAGVMRSVFKRRDRVGEAAVFGEWTYDLAPRLTATVGARLFATRIQTRADSFGLAQLPLRSVRARLTDAGFAPKVRLSYAFAPDRVLYAQLQDGFRAGGFNIPGRADGVAAGPDIQRYRPDRLRSYEFGGEATLFDKAVTVRAAVFKALWRGVQTDQFRPSGLPVTLNVGDGSNLGLEVEAVWRPGAHWRLRFSGLFDEPELTRSSDLFPAKADLGLPGVAKRTASVGAEYRWEVATGWQAEISAQAAYVGRSFLTFDGGAFTEMGGYGQGRIALSLEGQRWLAQAFVANVTDEGGNTFAFGNPFSRLRSRQETPLPPRTFGLTVRRRF